MTRKFCTLLFLNNIQTHVKFPAPHVFGMLDLRFSKYDDPAFSVIKFLTPFNRVNENNTHMKCCKKLGESAKRVKSSTNVEQPTGMFSVDNERGSLLMINKRRLIKTLYKKRAMTLPQPEPWSVEKRSDVEPPLGYKTMNFDVHVFQNQPRFARLVSMINTCIRN